MASSPCPSLFSEHMTRRPKPARHCVNLSLRKTLTPGVSNTGSKKVFGQSAQNMKIGLSFKFKKANRKTEKWTKIYSTTGGKV